MRFAKIVSFKKPKPAGHEKTPAGTLELVLDMRMAFAKSGRNRLRIYLY